MKYISILLLALLAACGPSPSTKERSNKQELDNPDMLGKLKDGRTVYHVKLLVPGSSDDQHLIYAGNDSTVSHTETTRSGKVSTTHHYTTAFIGDPAADSPTEDVVVINGIKYDVKEVSEALTRDEDQRRKERAEQANRSVKGE